MIFIIRGVTTKFGTYTSILDPETNKCFTVLDDIIKILGYQSKEEAIKRVSNENKYLIAIELPYLGSKIITIVDNIEDLLHGSPISIAEFIDGGFYLSEYEYKTIGRR